MQGGDPSSAIDVVVARGRCWQPMRTGPSHFRHVALALVPIAFAVAACGDDERATEQARGVQTAESSDEPKSKRDQVFDESGQLRESDRSIAGLILPRGLDPHLETVNRYVFYSDVPVAKVQAYFGPRLLTGSVDRVGKGAVYRSAVPRNAKGGRVKLDVSILQGSNGTRVEVREIPPAPKNPPSRQEVRQRVEQDWKRLD
jgi:hypothetical protein